MRLFGVPGGTLDQARATYGVLPPFDLAFTAPVDENPRIDHGGFIIDLAGTYALQYNQMLMAYPDWAFPTPAVNFNPFIDTTYMIGSTCDSNEQGITASTTTDDVCVC